MKRKILSLFLAIAIIIGVVPAFAEGADITVYLSMSRYGEVVNDKNGDKMAYREVALSGKDSYNLDDVFSAAHELYYDGEGGYASSTSEWGFGIDKLWGDTSYNFGYQINGGSESVMGLDHTVENGDYIDACIYKNRYPDTEGYAMFDMRETEVYEGEAFELTLTYVSGYDDSWNSVFSPCEGATILIDGRETEFVTDADGKVLITIDEAGEAVITAAKTKTVNEVVMPAITAPVCVANIKADISVEIIHNIAKAYAESDITVAGGNLPWIVADMAVYEELFPESGNVLTEAQKERCLAEIVDLAANATAPGDMAKSIIALRALGYDAKKLYTKDFEKVDAVSKLTALIDLGDTAVTNIYTLPYVIIALSQAEGYATDTQMEALINAAITSKDSWQDLTYGTDALTPMMLALAPYYNTNNDIKALLDETIQILKAEQRADGLIDGFEGYESASTGLAICALSALGEDAKEITNGGNSLIEGMLSTANETMNGFSNAFATEQGFRGFLAWQLLVQNKGKAMYDFSDAPMNEANVSGAENCPVVFNVTPSNGIAVIEGANKISNNCFDLEAGTYTYTVSASGYETASGSIEITDSDAEAREAKTVTVSLIRIVTGGGGGGGTVKEEEESEETPEPEETPVPEKILAEDTFADVESGDWYYQSVKYVYEKNLFSGTGNGFEPNTAMSRAMLVSVLYRLAAPEEVAGENAFDDVPQDMWYTESINWAAKNGIVSGVSEREFAPDADITREQIALIIYRYAVISGLDVSTDENTDLSKFSDTENISDYAVDAMKYMVAKGIISGKGAGELAPGDRATRAEVATMLMKFAEGVK